MDRDAYSLLSFDSADLPAACGCLPCGRKSGFRFHPLFNLDEGAKPIRTSLLCSSRTDSHISNLDKVPMDFSELHGKILSDPRQAEYAAKEEYLRTSAKLRSHSPDRRISNVTVYSVEPWFHYGLSREESDSLLKEQGSREGSFLVRTSRHLPGCFILCLMHNGIVHHFPITCVKDKDTDMPYLTLDHGRTKFKDLVQLIDFYQMNHGGYLPVHLQSFVTKAITIPHSVNKQAASSL